MPSCLGIHIEDYVIKYAKVQKEKDNIKVEAFNVVFYEDLKSTINQIIKETNSSKIPISINVSGEMYNYFNVPSMLSKPDMKKSVEIEFDILCEERNYKKNTMETRFLFAPSIDDEDRMQAIAISASATDLAQKKLDFTGYRIGYMHPISTSITNLLNPNENSNVVIINIEEQTKVTLVSKGQIARIETITEGMRDIINKISAIENSKQKAYEVCKNTTIYTQEGAEDISEGNEHIDSIMPSLYSIAERTKEIIEDNALNVSKIYITGLGASINNIDLYFQEYFEKIKCEILKPFFANVTSIKTSIKEYIEVNSAIALALNGMNYGYRELNFADAKAGNGGVDIKGVFNSQGGGSGLNISSGFGSKLTALEKMMIRISFVTIIAFLGYSVATTILSNKIEDKTREVAELTSQADAEIKKADADLNKIKKQTNDYQTAITNLKALDEQAEGGTRIIKKLAIPNLLYELVDVTPKKVQIISVKNDPQSNHITIEAQSQDYEQLGFLKAAIATKNYLLNVKSTSGIKSKGIVTTTIEGDLP